MRAILVSVEYSDLLSLTLPYNRHHFEAVYVVTSPADEVNVRPIAERCNAEVVVTDLFYRDGAEFNKFRALEYGLDRMDRKGWLCVMDADILWPKGLQFREEYETIKWWDSAGGVLHQDRGQLATPYRRMWDSWPHDPPFMPLPGCITSRPVVPESDWKRFPLHPQQHEWAGFSQIFHASDPTLGPPPWHETNWRTAGGADSFFQAKWPREKKIRPPFEVLHLGPAGTNWAGRVAKLADGTTPPSSQKRLATLQDLFLKRRGKVGMARFDHERLPKPPQ